MFKRLRWMVVGIGVSAGAQVWGKRKVASLAKRYSPPQVATRAAISARNELRAAVDEGRSAMRRREAELRGTARPEHPKASPGADRAATHNGRSHPPASH